MLQIRTAIRAAGLAILLALPQLAQAGVYYTVQARYSDDPPTWQGEGSYIIVPGQKDPNPLDQAKKRYQEVRGEPNVLEVRIIRDSDASGSTPEVLWSSSGGKVAEAPEPPAKGNETDAPPKGKKTIIVTVYKLQGGKMEKQAEYEFRTNTEYDKAKDHYTKYKNMPGWTATWNAPGWDTPKITMPEMKWVDPKGAYNPPNETAKSPEPGVEENKSKNSLVGTTWVRRPGYVNGGELVEFCSDAKVRFTPIDCAVKLDNGGGSSRIMTERAEELTWTQKDDGSFVIGRAGVWKGRYAAGDRRLEIMKGPDKVTYELQDGK